MSRDQRVQDNWALIHARDLAEEHKLPLCVVFCLVPQFLQGTMRHYGFMLRGLEEVERDLKALRIPFALLKGSPVDTLSGFVIEHNVAAVVSDFSPLRIALEWKQGLLAKLPSIPLIEIDAHNVVPVWVASDKQEVGARTIRKKITEKLPKWLVDIPPVQPLPREAAPSIIACTSKPIDWAAVRSSVVVDRAVKEVDWCTPGTTAALAELDRFIDERLKKFADARNDPNEHALSDLSPYLHFGHLSAQRMALIVKAKGRSHSGSVASFLEESIVRRELADNFCFYQPHYDSLKGAAPWARESLELHATDKREYVYSLEELDAARSHEDIWNAAQIQLVRTGKMHGFMRMYWAKKILEWSPTPQEALQRAIYLNDRYSLDGRDPNGYVGCAWSIMGTHDMGWAERPIFGKIRFMNYNGCKRKFDIKKFVATWNGQAKSLKRQQSPPTSVSKKARKG